MREPIDPRIGERVLLARRRKGWKQEDLARTTTMSRTEISQLEQGRQQVSAERLRTLAQALGTTADYLLGLSGDDPPRAADARRAAAPRA